MIRKKSSLRNLTAGEKKPSLRSLLLENNAKKPSLRSLLLENKKAPCTKSLKANNNSNDDDANIIDNSKTTQEESSSHLFCTSHTSVMTVSRHEDGGVRSSHPHHNSFQNSFTIHPTEGEEISPNSSNHNNTNHEENVRNEHDTNNSGGDDACALSYSLELEPSSAADFGGYSHPVLDACFEQQPLLCPRVPGHDDEEKKTSLGLNHTNTSNRNNAKTLDSRTAQKLVQYAHRRLAKAQLYRLLPRNNKNNNNNHHSSKAKSPVKTPVVLDHSQVSVNRLLGQGAFSAVYSLTNDPLLEANRAGRAPSFQNTNETKEQENTKYVLKVLRPKLLERPPMMASCAAGLMKEGLLLHHCDHVNLLRIHGWGTNMGLKGYANGKNDPFFLVLDRLECTLYDKLEEWALQKRHLKHLHAKQQRKKKFRAMVQRLPKLQVKKKKKNAKKKDNNSDTLEEDVVDYSLKLEERCQVWLDMAKGVSYLHSQRILHRDLKPDNIGFDAQGTLKIFDLDMARVLPRNHNSSSHDELYHFTRKVGSHRYMSPECARGGPYNTKADVYAVALMIHEVYTLKKPYDDVLPMDVFQKDFVLHPIEQPSSSDSSMIIRPPLPFSVLHPEKNNDMEQIYDRKTILKNNLVAPTWPSSLVEMLETSWGESIPDRPTMAQLQHQLEQQVIPEVLASCNNKQQ